MATIRKRGQSWQVHRKLYAVGCQLRDFAKRAHMVAVRLQDDAYRGRSTANYAMLINAISGRERSRGR